MFVALQGLVPEFVNPKYADASKNRFKKPTRLECMMQVLYAYEVESSSGQTQRHTLCRSIPR